MNEVISDICRDCDADTDIRRAMSLADKRMYEDKQRYYASIS